MAEIDGGALSFKSILDNDQLNTAIEETLRRVQGFSDAVVGTGDVMDSTTQEMVECIEVQKKVIRELEATVTDLDAKIDAIEPGDAQNILIEQAKEARRELDSEIQGLGALVAQLETLQRTNASTAMSFEQIRAMLGQIGAACETHENALASLDAEYTDLGQKMGAAFAAGRDEEYNALKERQAAIQGEIRVRQSLLNELRQQSNALEEEATELEKVAQTTNEAAKQQVSFRTQLREVREELAAMELAGETNTEAYAKLQARFGELSEAMDAITTQGNWLKRGERMWDGMLSGLSGVSGALSAAQGATALFAGENENLQKIMLKVQSLMAITIGLKEVQLMLDKDEAFQLVTINGLKEWWNKLLAIGRGEQVASTAATVADTTATVANTVAEAAHTAATQANTTAQGANTVAQGANTVATGAQAAAATAGTAANIGLAGAFRMVGAAIKSIPVFGWILAGISALIGVVSHFTSKAREAKKAQEEWYKSIAENAYKPIATIEDLATKWNALGDDLQAKQKFVEANKKAFDELGVAVNGVTDAENLLVANKEAFINAQIEKAKAMILLQQAQEKVKTLLEKEQEYNAMPDRERKTRAIRHGAGTGGYYTYEDYFVPNEEKAKLKKEIEELRKTITQGFTDAATAKSNGFKLLEKADKITGKKTTGGGSTTTQDPFLQKLNKYKTEYTRFQKWVNSGDPILVQSANQEFSKLLQEGATYIDYLKNQRDQILAVDVANRTKAQNQQLRQLNDAIAEETKNTVLEAFNNELAEQLTNANSVLEMLKIIEKKRQELSGDGTELDNAKSEALDNAENDAREQLKSETEDLLEEYASYVERKRRLEEQFNADFALLNERRLNAQSDAERAEIDRVIQNRKRQYEQDSQTSGNADYDAMLSEYGTFEQKKQAIIDKYDEQRRTAQEMGNQEMIAQIDKAQAEALSKFALDELQAHPDWELMFGDLDEITTRKLEELIAKINNLDGAYLGIEFDPKDLETLKKKIGEMKDEIQERNPFKALISSIKDYGKASDDESKKKALTNMFESTSSVIDLVGGSLDAVVQGMDKMGIAMDENTQVILGDIGGILDGAGQLASGIATGNPLSIIQGSIGLLSSAFSLFNSRDRKAEKRIKAHKKAIEQLERAYKQLEWQIEKALGGDVYKGQKEAIRNMEQQKQHLKGMWEAEESKKKTDSGKVAEYKEQYAELTRQIQDMYDEITKDILQTDAKDFAGTLGDSLVEAFKKGEDASKAFEETVNQVLQNAIVNQLKKKFLEQDLEKALNGLYDSMGAWNGDNFIFDGLTDAEIAAFKAKVEAAANNYNQALEVYSDLFKDLNLEDSSDESLTGAVKGVTEETANIVAGQMNAIRINQLEATAVLRQSLQALNTIALNTNYNRYLVKIDRIVSLLENQGESGRSQGLM